MACEIQKAVLGRESLRHIGHNHQRPEPEVLEVQ